MVSGKCYSFVHFLLLCLFFQKHILMSVGENCLNLTFNKGERLVIDYFFNVEASDVEVSPGLCPLITSTKGQFSIVYRMCSGPIDTAKCVKNFKCIVNRLDACYYKDHAEIYNDCTSATPDIDSTLADCFCTGAADNILASNEALRLKYGIETFPALVLNQKYDPCFKDFSPNGLKDYLCRAYKNELPFCKK